MKLTNHVARLDECHVINIYIHIFPQKRAMFPADEGDITMSPSSMRELMMYIYIIYIYLFIYLFNYLSIIR